MLDESQQHKSPCAGVPPPPAPCDFPGLESGEQGLAGAALGGGGGAERSVDCEVQEEALCPQEGEPVGQLVVNFDLGLMIRG